MPIEGIVDHPEAMTLPSAAYGMLVRLCHHFWESECRPLPIAEFELRHLARAHAPTWRTWKEPVLRIFESVRPELVAYHRLRVTKGTTITRIGMAGASKVKAKALRDSRFPADSLPAYASGIVPKREPVRTERPPAADKRPARPTLQDTPGRI